MDGTMNMSVSPVCVKDGEKYAFVTFTDGKRTAEGKIPECKIMFSEGFTEEEVLQLQDYMKRELTNLKKMAASIRMLDAIIK